jgi:precorrin-3B synthase
VIQLLHVIAVRGPRARDVLRSESVDVFRAAIGPDLRDVPPPGKRPAADPIGIHALRDDGFALGLSLSFGSDAETLIEFANAAANAGAVEIRSAPGHALVIVGLSVPAATDLQIVAQRLGFLVRADDPRRHIAACAGASVCSSGEIATRALAPLIAGAARSLFDGSLQVHVSGCRKGCAHAAPAGLTIVGRGGRCGIVVNGSARDLPIVEIAQQDLPESLARLAREVAAARRDGERVCDVLARWENARVAAVLAGELVGA